MEFSKIRAVSNTAQGYLGKPYTTLSSILEKQCKDIAVSKVFLINSFSATSYYSETCSKQKSSLDYIVSEPKLKINDI